MQKANQYLRQAEHAEQAARSATTDNERQAYEEMAKAWRDLAADRKASLARTFQKHSKTEGS